LEKQSRRKEEYPLFLVRIYKLKGLIITTSTQTIETLGDIKQSRYQSITAKARIRVPSVVQTIQSKGNVLELLTQTISAKGRIVTWRVVDIIDKVRDQKLVEEFTYVKEKVGEISYNKVEIANIVGVSTRVKDIPRTRPVVKEILEPSRIIQIKWITAKASIIH